MDPDQVKIILQLLIPILDAIVAATPNPFDNLAWTFIKKLLADPGTGDKVAAELYASMAARGMAAPAPA